jgi:hypothetical protein
LTIEVAIAAAPSKQVSLAPLLGHRPTDTSDNGVTFAGWTGLIQGAGFALTDVLLRGAVQAVIAALKSSQVE